MTLSERTNQQEDGASVQRQSTRQKGQDPPAKKMLTNPGRYLERSMIDIHEIAEAIFGKGASPRMNLHGLELSWDASDTATTLDDRSDEEAMMMKRELLAPVLPPRSSPAAAAAAAAAEKRRRTRGGDNGIVTSSRHLAIVLGKVVDIVMTSEESGTIYDVSALEALINTLETERDESFYDDEIALTYEELSAIVSRVVATSKLSVQEGTKEPTGICISNVGDKQCSLDLFWGKRGFSGPVSGTVQMANGEVRTRISF